MALSFGREHSFVMLSVLIVKSVPFTLVEGQRRTYSGAIWMYDDGCIFDDPPAEAVFVATDSTWPLLT